MAKIAFNSIVGIILLIMLAPLIVVFLVSFNGTEFLQFPPSSFSFRWYFQFFESQEFINSSIISLIIATISTAFVLFLSIMAAISIAKYDFVGKSMVQTFLLSPLFIPRILLGVALLILFVKMRLLGTLAGMVMAHVLILIPYALRSLMVGFYGIDPTLEEAARCLGANPLKAFFRITMPLLKSALVAAAMFSFIISFTDILLALFLTGPKTVTLPLRMFNYLEWNHDPFIAAIAVIQIIFIVVVAVILDKMVGLQKLM